MQIAGKLHRGFIPVRGGVRGKLPPDGTLHSQSKISPVAIKGGRESDCECMSQTTATDSRPQKTIKARQRRAATSRFSLFHFLFPQKESGRRSAGDGVSPLQKRGFATASFFTDVSIPGKFSGYFPRKTWHNRYREWMGWCRRFRRWSI